MRRQAVGVLNGNWRTRWKDELEEPTDRRVFIKEQNQLEFGDALQELKAADPDWERWFDDDDNIPAIIYWLDTEAVQKMCQRMKMRAAAIQKESHEEK